MVCFIVGKIKCKDKFISLFNEYENVILKVEAIG